MLVSWLVIVCERGVDCDQSKSKDKKDRDNGGGKESFTAYFGMSPILPLLASRIDAI